MNRHPKKDFAKIFDIPHKSSISRYLQYEYFFEALPNWTHFTDLISVSIG